MRRFAFETVDVFTERQFGGNPLAVFTDARGLGDGEMQALAAEFNLAETTFVLPPEDPANTARIRIFNRTAEMPFAGHPSVGTAYVLARRGRHDGGVLRLGRRGQQQGGQAGGARAEICGEFPHVRIVEARAAWQYVNWMRNDGLFG